MTSDNQLSLAWLSQKAVLMRHKGLLPPLAIGAARGVTAVIKVHAACCR
jgi:hypothetical protein